MSDLRAVLDAFEPGAPPVSVRGLARQMDLPPAIVEEMLAYWVRKGRLREVVTAQGCTQCGVKHSCPFIVNLPRYYERVTDRDAAPDTPPCHLPPR